MYPENPFHVWFILVYRYSPSTSEYFREKALCGQKIYLCQAAVTCFYVGSVRCILISRYIEMHFCLCWHVGQSDIQCCAGPWCFFFKPMRILPFLVAANSVNYGFLAWADEKWNGCIWVFASARLPLVWSLPKVREDVECKSLSKETHEGSWWSIHLNYLIHNSIMPNCQVSALHTGRPNKLNTAEAMAAAPRKFRTC